MTDDDFGHRNTRSIDGCTERHLCDVGLPGYSIAETVDPNGVIEFWILHQPQIGSPDADHGNPTPPHELNGPLRPDWRRRVAETLLRCGRATRAGRPCRTPVAVPGLACAHHRTEARR